MNEAGAIYIKAKLDKSEFEDDVASLDNQSGLSKIADKLGQSFSKVFSKIGSGAGKIGKAIGKIGGTLVQTMGKAALTAGKLGLAFSAAFIVITAIILAVLAISKAIERVFDKNKQLKTDIQYIIFAIQTALEPVINAIADALVKIIKFVIVIFQYAMAIANLIAGRNLFEKATPKAFAQSMKEANKNTKGTARSMKEIKKQLAGFDEMNILGKNTATSGGAGGGNIGNLDFTPSFNLAVDLAKIEEKIKDWWEKFSTSKWGDSGIRWVQRNFGLGGAMYYEIKKFFPKNFKKTMAECFSKLDNVFSPLTTIFKSTTDGFSTILQPFKDIFKRYVTGPAEKDLNETKNNILSGFAPFLNTMIKWINDTFGIFGVRLDYINTDINETGENIVDKIGGSLKDTIEDTNGLKNAFAVLPKQIKTTLEVVANTTKARKSIIELLQDIGKAGIEGAVGIKGGIDAAIKKIKARKGAIINLPGRGVPVGNNVYGGEAGREGIIPLTDSQQMELLGSAIGRYITINANVPIYLGNRQIAREIRQIETEDAFAGNR